MTLVVASLYLLCVAFLFGSAVFVYSRDPRSKLNGYYALLALSLLGWVGTLFVFGGLPEGETLLLVGRVNFAAIALAVSFGYLFVCELARTSPKLVFWIWLETLAVAALSVATGLVDRAETVSAGQHVTGYGPLFFLYLLHVLAYVVFGLVAAFRPVPGLRKAVRTQLAFLGFGILATALVGIVANAVLPYWFGNFRFIDVGSLSTIFLLAAIAYAVTVHHLFNIRVIIRATLVYTVLISLMLEVYQAAVHFLADLLPFNDPTERQFAATAIALIVNASTSSVLRGWLERMIDRLTVRSSKDGTSNDAAE